MERMQWYFSSQSVCLSLTKWVSNYLLWLPRAKIWLYAVTSSAQVCSFERKAGKSPAELVAAAKLRGEGAHFVMLRGLHYSQACVPSMGFIYGPNKMEQNILCSRLQSGLLWSEMKLKMCLRISRWGGGGGINRFVTFFFFKNEMLKTKLCCIYNCLYRGVSFYKKKRGGGSLFRLVGRIVL